jgi:hypothetical protein
MSNQKCDFQIGKSLTQRRKGAGQARLSLITQPLSLCAFAPLREIQSEKQSAHFRRPRPGVTLFELMVALFILTTAMAAIVQLTAVTAGQRRTIEQRRIALQEVANRAERIALLPWEKTAPEKLTTWQSSADLTAALPQATCTAEVSDEPGMPRARRIRLLVSWPNAAGQLVDPVAVTIWKFAEEGQP